MPPKRNNLTAFSPLEILDLTEICLCMKTARPVCSNPAHASKVENLKRKRCSQVVSLKRHRNKYVRVTHLEFPEASDNPTEFQSWKCCFCGLQSIWFCQEVVMNRALSLITFDVTGTLLVLQPPVAVKYVECAQKFGIDANSKEIMKNFKQQWKTLSIEHPNFGRNSGLGWRAWWTQIVVNSFKSAVPHAEEKALLKLADYLIDEYKTSRCWALAHGAKDLLATLGEHKIPIGVISNYDERLESVLNALHITPFFDFVVTSYDVGTMKPEKEIFDFALRKVKGNILPESCLHVGNSVEMDYVGAKRAGWKAALVGLSDSDTTGVDKGHVFQDLNHLKHHFECSRAL